MQLVDILDDINPPSQQDMAEEIGISKKKNSSDFTFKKLEKNWKKIPKFIKIRSRVSRTRNLSFS